MRTAPLAATPFLRYMHGGVDIAFRPAEIMWYHVDFLCGQLSTAARLHPGSVCSIQWLDSCFLLAACLLWSVFLDAAPAPTTVALPPCTFATARWWIVLAASFVTCSHTGTHC